MQVLIDTVGSRARHTGDADQIVEGGLLHRLHAPEMLQKLLSPLAADAADPVEGRACRRLGAQRAVIGDPEPVRLVSDPLQQEEGLRAARQAHWIRPAREEDLLELLGQADHWNLNSPLLRDLYGSPELAL